MVGTDKQVNWANKIKSNMNDILYHWEIDIKENGVVDVRYTPRKNNNSINNNSINNIVIDYIDRTKCNAEWYISKRWLTNSSSVVDVTDFTQELVDEICSSKEELKKIIAVLEGK